jgi:hypothetical protein
MSSSGAGEKLPDSAGGALDPEIKKENVKVTQNPPPPAPVLKEGPEPPWTNEEIAGVKIESRPSQQNPQKKTPFVWRLLKSFRI